MDSPPTLTRLVAALADRYRVERELGSGGTATVYLAEDTKHHRKVAIKVLREDLAASLGPKRFLREIEIAAQLQHPNILPLLDSGDSDGFLFYVMPFVAGQSLRERLAREGELPVHEAVRLLIEVVDALGYAHDLGVVHRDIKPDNVMLSGRHALITDFGVAKAISEATGRNTITTLGVALGTPAYMSPEQAAADPHIDHRTDIYAVGVLAYELLSGRPPFTGTTPQQILAAHVNVDPVPVGQHRPGLAPAVEQIVMKALSKRAADRFQSAAEMLAQLEPLSTPSTGMTPAQTRPVTLALASRKARLATLGAAVVLGGVFGLVWMGRSGSGVDVRLGDAVQVTSEQGLELHPSISPDGKLVAYVTRASGGRPFVAIRAVGGTRMYPLTDDTIGTQIQPRFSPDGQSVLYLSRGAVYAAPAAGGQARVVVPAVQGAGVQSVWWTPDGAGVGFVRRDSLQIVPLSGGTSRFVAHSRRSIRWCTSAPSGREVACSVGNSNYITLGDLANAGASQIVAVRVDNGQVTSLTDSVTLNQSPAWSSDGRVLYFVSTSQGTRDVFAVRVRNGKPNGLPVRVTVGLNPHTIAVSKDGTSLAYAALNDQGNIFSVPLRNGAPATMDDAVQVTTGTQVVEGMRASRDGKWLFYDSNVRGNHDIFRIALTGGDPEQLTDHPVNDFGGDLSPDGKYVAFHSFRSGNRDLWVQSLAGGPAQLITPTPDRDERYPVWSPDGSALAYYRNGTAVVIRRNAAGEWQTPRRVAAGGFNYPRWSPNGKQVVGYRSGAVVVADADSSEVRVVYAPRPGTDDPGALYPEWSADGRSIYFRSNRAGAAFFWSIPTSGGVPRLLARLDDPLRRSTSAEWTTDGKRFFFVVSDQQSDISVVKILKR